MMAPADTHSRRLGNVDVLLAARRLQQVMKHRRHAGKVGELPGLQKPHRLAACENFSMMYSLAPVARMLNTERLSA